MHERSQLWDPGAATWTDDDWAGRSVEGAVVYELHVGTFTEAGTFDSAIEKLDYLVDLGIDFDGTITWNGEKVDRDALDTKLLEASKLKPAAEIQVDPNRLAKYDAVAMVLADAQHLGVTHIGFTGIDQYN